MKRIFLACAALLAFASHAEAATPYTVQSCLEELKTRKIAEDALPTGPLMINGSWVQVVAGHNPTLLCEEVVRQHESRLAVEREKAELIRKNQALGEQVIALKKSLKFYENDFNIQNIGAWMAFGLITGTACVAILYILFLGRATARSWRRMKRKFGVWSFQARDKVRRLGKRDPNRGSRFAAPVRRIQKHRWL